MLTHVRTSKQIYHPPTCSPSTGNLSVGRPKHKGIWSIYMYFSDPYSSPNSVSNSAGTISNDTNKVHCGITLMCSHISRGGVGFLLKEVNLFMVLSLSELFSVPYCLIAFSVPAAGAIAENNLISLKKPSIWWRFNTANPMKLTTLNSTVTILITLRHFARRFSWCVKQWHITKSWPSLLHVYWYKNEGMKRHCFLLVQPVPPYWTIQTLYHLLDLSIYIFTCGGSFHWHNATSHSDILNSFSRKKAASCILSLTSVLSSIGTENHWKLTVFILRLL